MTTLNRPKPTRWNIIRTSRRGKRAKNNDWVDLVQSGKYDADFTVLVACDGVGSDPDAAVGARRIARATKRILLRYTREWTSDALCSAEDGELLELLRVLPVHSSKASSGASTMVAVLYCHVRYHPPQLLVVWAGDSRAQMMDVSGKAIVLTTSHTDEEGRLSTYYTSDGRVHGNLEVRRISLKHEPLAISVTTDGVHDRCAEDEWNRLLAYCLIEPPKGNRQFGDWVQRFLGENVSDNFSACVMLRRHRVPVKQLERVLRSGKKDCEGGT